MRKANLNRIIVPAAIIGSDGRLSIFVSTVFGMGLDPMGARSRHNWKFEPALKVESEAVKPVAPMPVAESIPKFIPQLSADLRLLASSTG